MSSPGLGDTELQEYARLHDLLLETGNIEGPTSCDYSIRQLCCGGFELSVAGLSAMEESIPIGSLLPDSHQARELWETLAQGASFMRIASFCNSRLPDELRWGDKNHTLTEKEAVALAKLPQSTLSDKAVNDLENKVRVEFLELENWQDMTEDNQAQAACILATHLGLSEEEWTAQRWKDIAKELDAASSRSHNNTSSNASTSNE